MCLGTAVASLLLCTICRAEKEGKEGGRDARTGCVEADS